MQQTPIRFADGVYFGLDEDKYHADPALGSSNIRDLLIDPAVYWFKSNMNPLEEEESEPSAALIKGSAFHKIVLEGEDAFDAEYVRGINVKEHPGALVTIDDLKAWLKEKGREVSGKKIDLIKRVHSINPQVPIIDVMKEELEATGKIILPWKSYDEVVVSSAMISKNPTLSKSFKGGMPEVSVFWTQDGVRFKCRFDYLKVRAIGDLKSFTNIMEKPVQVAVNQAIWGKRYDIQASHYMNGRSQLPQLVADGAVFGDHDPEWLKKVAASDRYTFVWVFYQSTGAPLTHAVQFDRGTMMDQVAQAEIQKAVNLYRDNLEKFGTDMWIRQEDIHVMTDSDVPAWVGI
jgi:hypothetical protein